MIEIFEQLKRLQAVKTEVEAREFWAELTTDPFPEHEVPFRHQAIEIICKDAIRLWDGIECMAGVVIEHVEDIISYTVHDPDNYLTDEEWEAYVAACEIDGKEPME